MRHSDRFHALDQLLQQHRALWQYRPFAQTEAPWATAYPALFQWLEELSDMEVQALADQPDILLQAVSSRLPALRALRELCQLPTAPRHGPLPTDDRLGYRIPGRKWQQIRAFVEALPPQPAPVLEWCAGKAHLGRLAGTAWQVPVLSLELDSDLCREARLLAARQDQAQAVVVTDVLDPDVRTWLQPQQQALALHACGDLHLHLLRLASDQRLQGIYLSPCCYHRTRTDLYQPLSRLAQSSTLGLDRQDRQLAVQETVTAGQRVRRLRDLEVSWRLGFDSLQRQVRGVDRYLPLPTPPKALFNGSFEAFCRWAADNRQIAMPEGLDIAPFEPLGWRRQRWVRRLERVSQVFRRSLELWLVLDAALFLEEQGYQVDLVEFCEPSLTPRNLLIQAWRTTGE